MPSIVNYQSKECNECGVIIPFNSVALTKNKNYSVVFDAISSLPGCTAVIEPRIHSFVPTSDLSNLYTSLRIFGCESVDRSTTLVKMSISDNNKEVFTDYTTVVCGTCSKDVIPVTATPSTSIGATPSPTPTKPAETPPPTPTPSSLVTFNIAFPTHMIDINCDSPDSIISAKLTGNQNRRYSYEFSALNNFEFVSFGNQSGEIFVSEGSINITTTIAIGSAVTETLVRCRVKDLETQFVGDTISVIKCIN